MKKQFEWSIVAASGNNLKSRRPDPEAYIARIVKNPNTDCLIVGGVPIKDAQTKCLDKIEDSSNVFAHHKSEDLV